MHLNIPSERPRFQLIFWDLECRDHWGFGWGSWPSGETWKQCKDAGMESIKFYAMKFGVFEIRYWPYPSPAK